MPQSFTQIYIHLVFSTRDREKIILTGDRDDLAGYIGGILRELDSPVVVIGVQPDHVHILLSSSKTKAVSELAEAVKVGTSHWLKKHSAHYRTFLLTGWL